MSARHRDAGMVRFEVSDTGIGIAPEAQEAIFESFAQADASTTRRFGGTGLGLTISKQLVGLMGGEIGLTSEPGRGATFWFSLHLDPPLGPRPDRLSAGADLRGLRALIVDDNATNRLILEESLRAWGVVVESSEDGEAGLAAFRRAADAGRPFELGILDFHMPNLDGIGLARAVSRAEEIPTPRLVLLTSGGQRGDATAALSAGISAYLTKPVRQAALYDALVAVTGLSPSSEPARLLTAHSMSEARSAHRGRLLVAEDNSINQKVAVRLLESLGHRVDLAANGHEAVAAVARTAYAAVLMDCQMPEMDGYEATMAIRRSEGTRRTPIIAMTAGAMEVDRLKCLAAGMDDFVAKPVCKADLAEVLGRWVGGEGEVEALPAVVSPPGPQPSSGLDPAALSELRDLESATGQQVVAELVAIYLINADQTLAELDEAVRSDDLGTVTRLAHGLKGSSATMGAAGVAAACADIERATLEDGVAVRRGLTTLGAEMAQARVALEIEAEIPMPG